MTALSGFIPFRLGNLESAIEVVRRIPGISGNAAPAIQAEWEDKAIRVLDPVSLLAGKLVLAATVPQEGRQDVNHLRILIPCIRAFLGELLQQVETDNLSARDWLKVTNQVLRLTTGGRARRIAREHQIRWSEVLPVAGIAQSQSAKIKRFREEQLERLL